MAQWTASGQQTEAPRGVDRLVGIAAPHVSPVGGWRSYQAAYSALRPEHKERTCVILATSHYGEPQKFGLTRKAFHKGGATLQNGLEIWWIGWRSAHRRGGVKMEDYCHSFNDTVRN